MTRSNGSSTRINLTDYCVLSTYRGAEDLDLTPIILKGSLASSISENIKFVESISDIISYGALEKADLPDNLLQRSQATADTT